MRICKCVGKCVRSGKDQAEVIDGEVCQLHRQLEMLVSQKDDRGRDQFEAWIGGEPYCESVERFPDDDSSCWRGSYRSIKVDLAWMAWQESRRTSGQREDDSE